MNKRMNDHEKAVKMLKTVNRLRLERDLISVYAKGFQGPEIKVSRKEIKLITIDVWSNIFPWALTDPDFELGEFTLIRVEDEVQRRILIKKKLLIPLRG